MIPLRVESKIRHKIGLTCEMETTHILRERTCGCQGAGVVGEG